MENKSYSNFSNTFFGKILVFSAIFLLISCAVPNFMKPSKVDKNSPVNAKDRARKNVTEGRGVSLKGVVGGSRRGTNYEFSSSNPLWRASLETIDFMPLSTVDYSGGVIITDWYGDSNNTDESIKITVRFLSNQVRSDSLKVIVHKKTCTTNSNCKISLLASSKISNELRTAIIRKAATLQKESKQKKK